MTDERIQRARRIAAAQRAMREKPAPAPQSRDERIRAEAARRVAAGILVDGEPFAPAAADVLRIADLIGDYKATPSAGGVVVELWVGDRKFALELRDIDAAASRLSSYGADVRAAADAAIAGGAEPAWPARPNVRTEDQ